MLPAGDPQMEWTLCLVGKGNDGQSRSVEVMAISRPAGLGEMANLGLTLAEGKRLLSHVQQQLVAEQANTHAGTVKLLFSGRQKARGSSRAAIMPPWRRQSPRPRW